MKIRINYTLWISAVIFLSNAAAIAGPMDSIGTKVRNGKVYIVHEVDKGTGIFTVAKRYGIAMDVITKENPGAEKGLIVGQLLYIPTNNPAPFEEPVVKEYFNKENKKSEIKTTEDVPQEKSTFATYHIVQPGETLFGIAKKYNTSVAIIKDLNSLQSEELSPGVKLVVPTGSEQVQSEEKEPVIEPVKENPPVEEKPKDKRHREKKGEKSLEQAEIKAEEKMDEVVQTKPVEAKEPTSSKGAVYSKKVENLPEFDVEKVTETGFAAILSSGAEQIRNVCYHHEAPENTIIMVTNPANKKAVFVKVTGKMEFDPNDSSVIKMSKNALSQIGLGAEGGAVEISYAR